MRPEPTSLMERTREQARRLGLRRFWKALPPPSNLRLRDASPAAIEEDAQYGLATGLAFCSQLRSAGLHPEGLDVLEIGPGAGFAGVAILAAFGARGAVADRWLAPWQDDYHRPYYRRLADLLCDADPGADAGVIRAIADTGGYAGGPIEPIQAPAERLHETTTRRFDAIFSNAVLEHVHDIQLSLSALHKLTRPGGYGFHQIDFRDHRNFEKPLDHLLFARNVFNSMSRRVHMEYGSQRRPDEYLSAFAAAGFRIVEYAPNEFADDAYLGALQAKLAQTIRSPYRNASREVLRDLGAFVVARRPD